MFSDLKLFLKMLMLWECDVVKSKILDFFYLSVCFCIFVFYLIYFRFMVICVKFKFNID